MAKQSGVSVSSVQRIWRKHGLQPHRVRQFKLSNDPQFADPDIPRRKQHGCQALPLDQRPRENHRRREKGANVRAIGAETVPHGRVRHIPGMRARGTEHLTVCGFHGIPGARTGDRYYASGKAMRIKRSQRLRFVQKSQSNCGVKLRTTDSGHPFACQVHRTGANAARKSDSV